MLEVFYRKVGGDYSNVLYRLENDETILLFLEKFLREDSYQNFLMNMRRMKRRKHIVVSIP